MESSHAATQLIIDNIFTEFHSNIFLEPQPIFSAHNPFTNPTNVQPGKRYGHEIRHSWAYTLIVLSRFRPQHLKPKHLHIIFKRV